MSENLQKLVSENSRKQKLENVLRWYYIRFNANATTYWMPGNKEFVDQYRPCFCVSEISLE